MWSLCNSGFYPARSAVSNSVLLPPAVSPSVGCTIVTANPEGGLMDMEEGQEAKVPNHGIKPSQEEIDRHNASHIPFRNW